MTHPKVYFPLAEPNELGTRLWGRFQKCLDDPFDARPMFAQAHAHLYGSGNDQGITYGVTRQGAQGEIAAVRVNRARALALARTALIAAPEVTYRAAALKSDSGAAKATTLGAQILEGLWKTRNLKAQWRELIWQAVGYSCSYKFAEWNPGAGEMLPAEDGGVSFEGDVVTHNVSPWRVHFDTRYTSWDDCPWAFVRLYRPRADLAALTSSVWMNGVELTGPEAYDAIMNAQPDARLSSMARDSDDSDVVSEVHFLHKPTPSLPYGAHHRMLSGSCLLTPPGNPLTGPQGMYDEWPLLRLAEGSYVDTPFAWTSFWDALGSQEVQDAIVTTLSTIITTLGTTVIAKEKGSEFDLQAFVQGGVRELEVPRGGKFPEGVQLATFPKDAIEFLEKMEGGQQAIMALNDVSLGRPQTAQMNAQAFAVLASMAVQQAAPMQQAAVEVLAKEGRLILGLYAKHAKGERLLRMVGKQNASLLEGTSWTGADLGPVKDVAVEIGNPNEQTAPGRIMKLQTLAQIGVPLTIEQAQQVLDTGRVEQVERATRNENLCIIQENEMLQAGKVPTVEATENHPLHFREHHAELCSEDVKADPMRANPIRAHLDAHYMQQWGVSMMADPMAAPRMRFMLGLAPIDPSLFVVPPPMPGPTDGTQPPAEGQPSGTQPPVPEAPPDVESQAATVTPPVNPVDGEEFSPSQPPAMGVPS